MSSISIVSNLYSMDLTNNLPSMVVGGFVFLFIIYLSMLIMANVRKSEDSLFYDGKGCRIDAQGKVVRQPIYARNRITIIGYDDCITRKSPLQIYGIGLILAFIGAVFAIHGTNTLSTYVKNNMKSSAS